MGNTKREYNIWWHNMVCGEPAAKVADDIAAILGDMRRIAEWERAGKLEYIDVNHQPSLAEIIVLDQSIVPELERMETVSICDVPVEDE